MQPLIKHHRRSNRPTLTFSRLEEFHGFPRLTGMTSFLGMLFEKFSNGIPRTGDSSNHHSRAESVGALILGDRMRLFPSLAFGASCHAILQPIHSSQI